MERVDFLLVAATPAECGLLAARTGISLPELSGVKSLPAGEAAVDLLITGIGIANCALKLGRYLAHARPMRILQFGVAGSYPGGPGLGTVVEVRQETYADLGAHSPAGFLDLAAIGIPAGSYDGQPYYNTLPNPHAPLGQFPEVAGNTVQAVSGENSAIAALLQQFPAQVESMEGAAFFQTCLDTAIPFHQIRAISNAVETRNREAWRMKEAVIAAQEAAWQVLTAYLSAPHSAHP